MTSAPEIDERTHRDTIAPLLAAQIGQLDSKGDPVVYDYGKVPGADDNDGDLPPIYLLITIERRAAGVYRAGRAGISGWRVTVRGVGRTIDEARWALHRATQALDEQVIAVGAKRSTPLTYESSQPIEPDEGLYSGLLVWTYVL